MLASEIYRDDGTVKGVRPLGGRLEFGETWRDALVREFEEELGVAIDVVGSPLVLENIFTHHGTVGHEVAFVADVAFTSKTFLRRDAIEYFEDSGEKCIARWYDVSRLDCGNLELYPNGLKDQLQKRAEFP